MWARIVKCCLALQAAVSLFAVFVDAALDPIVIVGSHFFYKTNGSEFFIRGVAYIQSNGTSGGTSIQDPLADQTSCQRDIPYLQKLRTNVVRVYEIDPTQDHSACMSLLDAAGIYVLVDLSNTLLAIARDTPTWNLELYTSYTSAIDSMQKYTNVLGFFAGNEVINSVTNSDSAAFVKAAVRDMKSYIQAQGYRSMGIGYASSGDASIIGNMEDYFNCGDSASSIDFLGLNIYSWCGASSYTQSGYSALTDSLSNYSVPVFFSEYGCNTGTAGGAGRKFTEVQALYGSQMTGVFSGGIVYEYFEEQNDYGLVSVSSNSISTLADFNAFSTQMASASPSSTASSAYTPTNTIARSCPTTGSAWLASENLPPFPNSILCNCMFSSLSCVVASGVSVANAAPTLFSQICGIDSTACSGIAANATTGKYGAYSVCNVTQQISWAMNQYYLSQNNLSTSCDFGGQAHVQSSSTGGTQCQALLAQAGPQGTGPVTSLSSSTGTSSSTGISSSTGTSLSTGTSSGISSSGTDTSPGGGAGAATDSGGGLSTGAKAGIAVAAILIVAILAGIGIYVWRRKRKTKQPPLSGEGGLEVGDAPPEFTALRRAEMEAKEADRPHIITGEPMSEGLAVHAIQLDGNELDASRERQELDSTGVSLQPRHAELDATANLSELGDSTRRSELSPNRKPLSSSASPKVSDPMSQSPTSASWSNKPWSNPGIAGLGVAQPVTHQSANEAAEAAEMRRIEEEERRIDAAIAESERLQALRRQKEELQKRKSEMMARASGGPGGGPTAPN